MIKIYALLLIVTIRNKHGFVCYNNTIFVKLVSKNSFESNHKVVYEFRNKFPNTISLKLIQFLLHNKSLRVLYFQEDSSLKLFILFEHLNEVVDLEVELVLQLPCHCLCFLEDFFLKISARSLTLSSTTLFRLDSSNITSTHHYKKFYV